VGFEISFVMYHEILSMEGGLYVRVGRKPTECARWMVVVLVTSSWAIWLVCTWVLGMNRKDNISVIDVCTCTIQLGRTTSKQQLVSNALSASNTTFGNRC